MIWKITSLIMIHGVTCRGITDQRFTHKLLAVATDFLTTKKRFNPCNALMSLLRTAALQ